MEKRSAIVFGSTGLVGNLLLEELINSPFYSAITAFVRAPSGLVEPKVEEIIYDFSDPGTLSGMIKGDDIFVCLGTTIKKAGSVANMERIDRDLPVKIAEIASSCGVKRIAVVSSIGASAASPSYYLRIKGEMEKGILGMKFENISIVRPSMLLGDRREKRRAEMVGKVMMTVFRPVLTGKLMKYRAIHGRDVARAMIVLLQKEPGIYICESDEVQRLANSY